MARHVDKLWVTNGAVLKAAYGRAGLAAIRAGLRAVAAADRARGLSSRVLDVSSQRSARSVGAAAVTDPGDRAGTLTVVAAACAATGADYLVLLGGPQVVPHQLLDNPAYDASDDPERTVPSDLPYATGVASRSAGDHVGATRVVGRLPDLPGATDPAGLLGLLAAARDWHSRPRTDYVPVLAVTTAAWRASTALGVHALPGPADPLRVVPPEHAPWPVLRDHRTLFANLHGATADPCWYGDRTGPPLPVALSSGDLLPSGRGAAAVAAVAAGTVVGTEACFGAELYDPALAQGRPGLAITWLQQGAHAVVGSTGTAYGGVDDALGADVLVRAWLGALLDGASTGRAFLQARQQFAAQSGELDPVDLKTLAQFLLLGDPSVHPVATVATPAAAPAARPHSATARATRTAPPQPHRVPGGRAARRAVLAGAGDALGRSVVRPRAVARRQGSPEQFAALARSAAGTGRPDVLASVERLTDGGARLRTVAARAGAGAGAGAIPGVRFHVLGGGSAAGNEVVVVREGADGVVHVRRLVARALPR